MIGNYFMNEFLCLTRNFAAARKECKRFSLYCRCLASLVALFAIASLAGVPAHAQTSHATAVAADLANIRKGIGAFEAEFRLSNKVVLLDRDPDKVYATAAKMTTLIDDKRYNTLTQSEFIYFRDDAATAEIVTRNMRNVFDGARHLVVDFENKNAKINSDDDFPHLNPKNLWLDYQGQKLEDRLLEPEVEYLGGADVNGVPAVGFQVVNNPVAYGEGARTRFWIAQSDEGPWPVRMESGNLQSDGAFLVRHEVDVLQIGRTKSGMPFPLAATQRLYNKNGDQLVCFTERKFETVSFRDNVVVNDSNFEIRIPDKTFFYQ